jgi:hypothetical protein
VITPLVYICCLCISAACVYLLLACLLAHYAT